MDSNHFFGPPDSCCLDNGHPPVDPFHGSFVVPAARIQHSAMTHVSAVGRKRHDRADCTSSQLIRGEELANLGLTILPENRKQSDLCAFTPKPGVNGGPFQTYQHQTKEVSRWGTGLLMANK